MASQTDPSHAGHFHAQVPAPAPHVRMGHRQWICWALASVRGMFENMITSLDKVRISFERCWCPCATTKFNTYVHVHGKLSPDVLWFCVSTCDCWYGFGVWNRCVCVVVISTNFGTSFVGNMKGWLFSCYHTRFECSFHACVPVMGATNMLVI